MGWDNPPVPWRDLERLLSWRTGQDSKAPGQPDQGQPKQSEHGEGELGEDRPRQVARLQGNRAREAPPGDPPWAELHCHSSYSFLDEIGRAHV